MTPQEQLMLELLNRARMDPAGEARRFGIDLNEGVTASRLSATPKQVLAGSDTLAKSADSHSAWMITNDIFSHGETRGTRGFTGAAPQDRMVKAGYAFTGNWTAGENIAFRGVSGKITDAVQTQLIMQQHEDLFVDAGVAGRGRRVSILNGTFEEVGVGQQIGVFTMKGVNHNSSLVTQNFAMSGTKIFVTGVVYNDAVVRDDFFSVGEQVARVSVTSAEAISDVTGSGGGYELLYTASGSKAIKFALSSGAITVGLTLATSNVKVGVINGKEIWSNVSVSSVSTNVTELHVLGGGRCYQSQRRRQKREDVWKQGCQHAEGKCRK